MQKGKALIPYVQYTCECGCSPKVVCDATNDGYINKATGICAKCHKPCKREDIVYLEVSPEQAVSDYRMYLKMALMFLPSSEQAAKTVAFYYTELRDVLEGLSYEDTEFYLSLFLER